MVDKYSIVSKLPSRIKLVAYCYSCDEHSEIDHEKYHRHTVLEISEELNCPKCDADNMGIRPVLKNRRYNMRSLFSSIASRLRLRKIML